MYNCQISLLQPSDLSVILTHGDWKRQKVGRHDVENFEFIVLMSGPPLVMHFNTYFMIICPGWGTHSDSIFCKTQAIDLLSTQSKSSANFRAVQMSGLVWLLVCGCCPFLGDAPKPVRGAVQIFIQPWNLPNSYSEWITDQLPARIVTGSLRMICVESQL